MLQWRSILQVSDVHKKGVTCLTGLIISHTTAMFASASSDGLVVIWELVLPYVTLRKLISMLSYFFLVFIELNMMHNNKKAHHILSS